MTRIIHPFWFTPAVVTFWIIGLEKHHVVNDLAPLDAIRFCASARNHDDVDVTVTRLRVRLVKQDRVASLDARLHAIALAVQHSQILLRKAFLLQRIFAEFEAVGFSVLICFHALRQPNISRIPNTSPYSSSGTERIGGYFSPFPVSSQPRLTPRAAAILCSLVLVCIPPFSSSASVLYPIGVRCASSVRDMPLASRSDRTLLPIVSMSARFPEICNRMLLHCPTESCRLALMDWKSRIEALMAAGMTVNEIAEAMGVTPNAVREILQERTKSPRAEAAFALLRLCDEKGVKDAA